MSEADKQFGHADGVSLKEHLGARIDDVDKRHHVEMDALRDIQGVRFSEIAKATEAALASMDARLLLMNEFRDQLKAQKDSFITREAAELLITGLSKNVDENTKEVRGLRESRAELAGKASQTSVYLFGFIAVAGLVLSIIKMFVM